MSHKNSFLRILFGLAGAGHLIFGIVGLAFPRWFFSTVPPWPPLHVGQIQIGGVFDLAMAAVYIGGARDVHRYGPLVIMVGIVAEWSHALVRIGHIIIGDNPIADLFLPGLMLILGAILLIVGLQLRSD